MHKWRLVGAGRMLLYVVLNAVYSFSSNSNVLCFEPQLNPAGRDLVSKVMVGFGLGAEHLKRSLLSSCLSVTFCSLSYLPGPLKRGNSVWIWVPVCREGRSHGWAGSLLCWESSLPFKALLLRGVEGRLLWGGGLQVTRSPSPPSSTSFPTKPFLLLQAALPGLSLLIPILPAPELPPPAKLPIPETHSWVAGQERNNCSK